MLAVQMKYNVNHDIDLQSEHLMRSQRAHVNIVYWNV